MLTLMLALENASEAEPNTATSSAFAALASLNPRILGVSAA